jgi:hypothetical protein
MSPLTGTKVYPWVQILRVHVAPRCIPCDQLAIHEWGTLMKLVGYIACHSARLVFKSAFHNTSITELHLIFFVHLA